MSTGNGNLGELGAEARRIGHDLRGLLGVLRLEGFSLSELEADLRGALGATAGSMAGGLAELEEIAGNLREAAARGTALADRMHELGVELEQRGAALK